jgi:hypothetical protein
MGASTEAVRYGGRLIWRRERDSNPRYPLRYTRFRGARLQPLGHLSMHAELQIHFIREAVSTLRRCTDLPNRTMEAILVLETCFGSRSRPKRPTNFILTVSAAPFKFSGHSTRIVYSWTVARTTRTACGVKVLSLFCANTFSTDAYDPPRHPYRSDSF